MAVFVADVIHAILARQRYGQIRFDRITALRYCLARRSAGDPERSLDTLQSGHGPYVSNYSPIAFDGFVENLQLPTYGRVHRHLHPPRELFQSAAQSPCEMEMTSSEHVDRSHACRTSYRPREGGKVCNAVVESLSKERINSSAVDRLKHARARASACAASGGGMSSAAVGAQSC